MGGLQFQRVVLDKRVGGIKFFLDSLLSLEDPNIEYTLICSYSAFIKFSFSLWTIDSKIYREGRQELDGLMCWALEVILRNPLMDPQMELASLPVSKMDFGLRREDSPSLGSYLVPLFTSLPHDLLMRGEKDTPLLSPRLEALTDLTLKYVNSWLEVQLSLMQALL